MKSSLQIVSAQFFTGIDPHFKPSVSIEGAKHQYGQTPNRNLSFPFVIPRDVSQIFGDLISSGASSL